MRERGRRAAAAAIVVTAIAACLQLQGCGLIIGHAIRESQRKSTEESQVTASLARLQQLMAGGDVERIVDMFTTNGELVRDGGTAQKGHAQIRASLQAAAGAGLALQDYTVTANSTRSDGGTATQEGRWRQVLRATDGSTQASSGTFQASWAHQPDGRWLLSSLRTTTAQ